MCNWRISSSHALSRILLTTLSQIKTHNTLRRLFAIKTTMPPFSTLYWKKRLPVFPPPAGMSLTKLSLAGDEKNYNLFYSVPITGTHKNSSMRFKVFMNYSSPTVPIVFSSYPSSFSKIPEDFLSTKGSLLKGLAFLHHPVPLTLERDLKFCKYLRKIRKR